MDSLCCQSSTFEFSPLQSLKPFLYFFAVKFWSFCFSLLQFLMVLCFIFSSVKFYTVFVSLCCKDLNCFGFFSVLMSNTIASWWQFWVLQILVQQYFFAVNSLPFLFFFCWTFYTVSASLCYNFYIIFFSVMSYAVLVSLCYRSYNVLVSWR